MTMRKQNAFAMRVVCLSVALLHKAAGTCSPSETNFCMKLDVYANETGLYTIDGQDGSMPDLTVKIGTTYTFDQSDASNWYHAVGFAYYPDGAHGETWGGAERDEVEESGELQYKINGANPTCAEAGNTGLDCYEPEFFYPRSEWLTKTYRAELTITQAMADQSHGGVIYYFCHIHSKMSGRLIIQNADGSAFTPTTNPEEIQLYPSPQNSGVDATCGTAGATLTPFVNGGPHVCDNRWLCGTLDTDFEKCMQAISCKMSKEMYLQTSPDHSDKIAIFMQQMIPHHINAMNMAKILLKTVPATQIAAAMDEDELTNILWGIVNTQAYQVHVFRNYLNYMNLMLETPPGYDPGYNSVDVDDISSACGSCRIGALLLSGAIVFVAVLS